MRTQKSLLFLAALTAAAQNLPNPHYELRPHIGAESRGEGRRAIEAVLHGAFGIAEDAAGNIYIAESNAGIIRRVKTDGTIERFAGSGMLGNTGSGRPALETDLTRPTVLAMDADGALLFYEAQYCRIRRVQTDGNVGDVAGTGRCGSSGFQSGNRDRKALDTDITGVGGMAVDEQGRVVFTETAKHVVRRVDSDGFVRTIAGTGVAGSTGNGALATAATLNSPVGLTFDGAGNLYIADGANCQVRKIDTAGNISLAAGGPSCAPTESTFTGAGSVRLSQVGPLAYDAATNSLYVGMPKVYRIVRVDFTTTRTSQFLGNGKLGVSEPAAPLAFPLNDPSGILASHRAGIVVAVDSASQVYRVQNGVLQNLAGMWPRLDADAAASTVQLRCPAGLLPAADGTMLFTDSGAGLLLRKSEPGSIEAVAGMAWPTGYATGDNGPALKATLAQPSRVVQKGSGEIYISTATGIRVVDTQGVMRTARGSLSNPTGMVLDSEGRLLYSETGKNQVLRLDLSTNKTTLIAGTGIAGFSGDGAAATAAKLNSPGDLAFDSAGNLLIVDMGNHRIRRVTPDGNIETIAGNGLPLAYRDITGLAATRTGLGTLQAMAIDADDNIYISESVRVNRISKDGRVSVVTGFLAEDDEGSRHYLDGPLAGVGGLAVDSAGRIYISVAPQGKVYVAEPRR